MNLLHFLLFNFYFFFLFLLLESHIIIYNLIAKMVESEDFKSKITVYVVVCWILAAFGGLMFGYDIGISGTFLFLFFFKPHVSLKIFSVL